MIGGAVGHPEGRRGAVIDAGRNPDQAGGGHHDLFGEGAVQAGAGDPVTNGEIGCVIGDFVDHTGELAAWNERRRHADLVLVRRSGARRES